MSRSLKTSSLRRARYPKPAPVTSSWGRVAEWYDQLFERLDNYQAKVILPNLLRLLPPQKLQLIDIGCGHGFFSRAYAARGAKVLGVDISEKLIRLAQKYQAKNVQFKVAAAEKISPAATASFDAGLLVLVLQNLKTLQPVLKEAARVLAKGGQLAIVINHPCFRVLKASSWGFDQQQNVQYRRLDKYKQAFAVKVDMTPGTKLEQDRIYTLSFHRPLQQYIKALAAAGFAVTDLEEWVSHKRSQLGPRVVAENTARAEFPLFMAILASKL